VQPTPSASASPEPTAPPSPTPAANAIEVVAGGGAEDPRNGLAATSARLVRPTGVAVDPDGTIWIVDANLSVLLHVGADGTLTDLAGGLFRPEGIARRRCPRHRSPRRGVRSCE